MSSSSADAALQHELAVASYHLLVTQILFGCGYCLLVWDWLVCLPREIIFVWKELKFSLIKVLYLFSRYWPICSVPFVLYSYTVNHSLGECKRLFRIPVALATFNQLSAESILAARTAAFVGNKTYINISLATLLVGLATYQLWVVFGPMELLPFIPPATTGPCLPTTPDAQILGFFFSSFIYDGLVTALMVYRYFELRRESMGRNPLVRFIVYEGLWYFAFVSIANLVNGVMYFQKIKTLSAIMVPFSNMIPNILACRLIIDLREQGTIKDNNWIISRQLNNQHSKRNFLDEIWNFLLPPRFAVESVSGVGGEPGKVTTMRFVHNATTELGSSGSDSSVMPDGLDVLKKEKEKVAAGLDDREEEEDAKDVELGIVEGGGGGKEVVLEEEEIVPTASSRKRPNRKSP